MCILVAPPVEETKLFSYEDGDLDFSDQDDIPSIPSDIKLTNGIVGTSTMETQTHQVYMHVAKLVQSAWVSTISRWIDKQYESFLLLSCGDPLCVGKECEA